MNWHMPAWFGKTFLEDDGSLAMAEVHTMAVAMVVDGAAVRDLLTSGQPFPYVAVCASVGTLVVAYGLAKLIRSGKWMPSNPTSTAP